MAGEFRKAVDLYQVYVQEQVTRKVTGQMLKERNRYATHAVLGAWQDRAGNAAAAVQHYRQCVDAIDRTWARLKLQSSKENFLGGEGHPLYVPPPARVFERLIRLQVASGDAASALECSEHFKARGLVDLLGRRATRYPTSAGEELVARERQLYKQLQSSQATAGDGEGIVRQYMEVMEQIRARDAEYADVPGSGTSPRPRSIRALLDPETVVVEYFIGTRDSTVFVVSAKGVQAVPLGMGTEAVAEMVNDVRRALRAPGPVERTRAALAPLSRAVATPFLPFVRDAKRLVIVPHGSLQPCSLRGPPGTTAAATWWRGLRSTPVPRYRCLPSVSARMSAGARTSRSPGHPPWRLPWETRGLRAETGPRCPAPWPRCARCRSCCPPRRSLRGRP